jgi:hypothetical protein
MPGSIKLTVPWALDGTIPGSAWGKLDAVNRDFVLQLISGLSAAVPVGPDPPPNPDVGQLWWRTDPDGELYIWYDDGGSLQWVPATTIGTTSPVTPFAPIIFPPNPNVGDVYPAPNGTTYIWDGTVWTKVGAVVPVFIGPNPPAVATAQPGQLWWRNDPDGQMYILYDDGSSIQWVTASPSVGSGGIPDAPSNNLMYGRRDHTWGRAAAIDGDTITGRFYWPPIAAGGPAIEIVDGSIFARGQSFIQSPCFVAAANTGPSGFTFDDILISGGGLYKTPGGPITIRQPLNDSQPRIESRDASESGIIIDSRGGTHSGLMHGELIFEKINPSNFGLHWTDATLGNVAWIYSDNNRHLIFRNENDNGASTTMQIVPGVDFANLRLGIDPIDPMDAATKQYVDTTIASIVAFQGTWQVATNIPNLDPAVANPVGGDYWLAATADPLVGEVAPPEAIGIAGQIINNADLILWSNVDNAYHHLSGTGGGITRPEADRTYLRLDGGTLTGNLFLNGDPTIDAQAATKSYVDDNTFDDAPADNTVYGRSNNDWEPAVPLVGGVMTGLLTLFGAPTLPLHSATKLYVDNAVAAGGPFLPLAGGTMAGFITLSGAPTANLHAATKLYVDNLIAAIPPPDIGGPYLPLTGGILTGLLTLSGAPTANLHAATKLYVDTASTPQRAVQVPTDGPITEANVQLALQGLETRKATVTDMNLRVLRAGDTMGGILNLNLNKITNLGAPTLNADAATKLYVDNAVSTLIQYQGTWQVAANIPNLITTLGGQGHYYVARTANPTISEFAPAGIPGIGGQLIANGDWIIWQNTLSEWERLAGGGLTRPEADATYLAKAGGTMTGPIVLHGNPTANLHAVPLQFLNSSITDRVILVWTTGANYVVNQLVFYDNRSFRVGTAITNAPATPNFTTIKPMGWGQSDYWTGDVAATNWAVDNWIHLATLPAYGTYRFEISSFHPSNDSSYMMDIVVGYATASVVLIQSHQGTGTFKEIRLSQASNGGDCRVEMKIGIAQTGVRLKLFVHGEAREIIANNATVPKPPIAIAGGASIGGTQRAIIHNIGNGALSSSGEIDIDGRLKFYNANVTDINDGTVGVRQHSRGMNLVGAATEASDTTRYINLHGMLESIQVVSGVGVGNKDAFVSTQDNHGLTLNGGGRFYKASGTGVVIRQPSGNQQPQIENNDGSNRRAIIDTVNGDLRYMRLGAGELSGGAAACIDLAARFARSRSEGADAGIGLNPPTLRTNSNSIHMSNANYVGSVFLPPLGYLGQGEPFFYEIESDFSVIVYTNRSSMTSNLNIAAHNTAVFIYNASTNLWDYVGTVWKGLLQQPNKFNSLNLSYILPSDRGIANTVLTSNGAGGVTWSATAPAPGGWESHVGSSFFQNISRLRSRIVQGGSACEIQFRGAYSSSTLQGETRNMLQTGLPNNKRPTFPIHSVGVTTPYTIVSITIDSINGMMTAASAAGGMTIPLGSYLDFSFVYPLD